MIKHRFSLLQLFCIGEYLLHEEIITYVGKVVAVTEPDSDEELDAEMRPYSPVRGVIISGGRKRPDIFNGVYIFEPESTGKQKGMNQCHDSFTRFLFLSKRCERVNDLWGLRGTCTSY